MEDAKHHRLLAKLAAELGPDVMRAIEDEATTEVILNPDGRLWAERQGEAMRIIGSMESHRSLSVIGTVADAVGTVATAEQPIVEAELPFGGQRFEGIIPPAVEQPAFAIRCGQAKQITLADYVVAGTMNQAQADTLRAAVRARRNILVVGGTGSGKTTLVNALLHSIAELSPDDRVVVIEDTRELRAANENTTSLRTTPTVSMNDLLRATLRLRPERIVVGEVRGPEALELLKSWNTGHPGGLSTVHANGAEEGLLRLAQLAAEAGSRHAEELIAATVHVVAVIAKENGVRRVTDVVDLAAQVRGVIRCVGCGCDDLHACQDRATGLPCHWLDQDPVKGEGVCSLCHDHLASWQDRRGRENENMVTPVGGARGHLRSVPRTR